MAYRGKDDQQRVRPRVGREHSLVSVLAGTVAAYGTFAIIAAVVMALLGPNPARRDVSEADWASQEAIAGAVLGLVLLVSYFVGGYVAGRMARGGGRWHGLAVGVFNVALGLAIGALGRGVTDPNSAERNLHSIGMPTSWADWSRISVVSTGLAVAAVLAGAFVGGAVGGRWQRRSLARAVAAPVADVEAVLAAAARKTGDTESRPDGHADAGDGEGTDELTDLRAAAPALSAEAWRLEADERRALLRAEQAVSG